MVCRYFLNELAHLLGFLAFNGISTLMGYFMLDTIYTQARAHLLGQLNDFKYCYVTLTIQFDISFVGTQLNS